MAFGMSSSPSATLAARKAPEKEPICTGWSDCLAKPIGSSGETTKNVAMPATVRARLIAFVTRLEFLFMRRAGRRRPDSLAALTFKHGLFAVVVQPREIHNLFTRDRGLLSRNPADAEVDHFDERRLLRRRLQRRQRITRDVAEMACPGDRVGN